MKNKQLLVSFVILIFSSISLAIYNLIIGEFSEKIYFGFPLEFLTVRKYIKPINNDISVNLFNFFIDILICYFMYKLIIWFIKRINIDFLKKNET